MLLMYAREGNERNCCPIKKKKKKREMPGYTHRCRHTISVVLNRGLRKNWCSTTDTIGHAVTPPPDVTEENLGSAVHAQDSLDSLGCISPSVNKHWIPSTIQFSSNAGKKEVGNIKRNLTNFWWFTEITFMYENSNFLTIYKIIWFNIWTHLILKFLQGNFFFQ